MLHRQAVIVVWLATATCALAIAPPYVSDEELAQLAVVVVGRWDKAPLTDHNDVSGNELRHAEIHTKLVVERVIAGDLQPGTHDLVLGWFIGWQAAGGPVISFTSTEMIGDVADVTEANLWLLKWDKSWDDSDKQTYLTLHTYRGVQPLALEPYFRALRSREPDDGVAKLLSAADPTLLLRALEYVDGGVRPWPYWTDFDDWFRGHPKDDKRRPQYAEKVEALLGSENVGVRRLATAVYASLRAEAAVPRVRRMLDDQDGGVRAIAIGFLAKQRDEESIKAICRASAGVQDAWLACAAIARLAEWRDLRLVAALLVHLENDQFVYQHGDDFGVPAMKARAALHAITGAWFPYHVAAASDAWAAAEAVADPEQRQQRLKELLPDGEFPVAAELVGRPRKPPESPTQPDRPASDSRPSTSSAQASLPFDDAGMLATVRVRNISGHPVTIAKLPASAEQAWPSGVAGCAVEHAESETMKERFISLAPGRATEFAIKLDSSFLLAEPTTRKLALFYNNLAKEHDPNSWIGILRVQFGPLWQEARNEEHVEELWPNGNLRAVGTTVNGKRFGEWQFFNEAGDRISTVDYTGGHASAECNPEHPHNKGAGRRAASRPTGP